MLVLDTAKVLFTIEVFKSWRSLLIGGCSQQHHYQCRQAPAVERGVINGMFINRRVPLLYK